MPGLSAASMKEVWNVNENAAGLVGLPVDTPPVNENAVKGWLTVTAGMGTWVVADDTAAADTAKAATAAPPRIAIARVDVPRFLTSPPQNVKTG